MAYSTPVPESPLSPDVDPGIAGGDTGGGRSVATGVGEDGPSAHGEAGTSGAAVASTPAGAEGTSVEGGPASSSVGAVAPSVVTSRLLEAARVTPRLARHQITMDDGHRVGVAVCGTGIPAVLVHGFTAEGILYAQTLSRLVGMGFKVVAVDVAGHGATAGLPTGGRVLSNYADLLGRVLDCLGIPRAVLVGHSLGGRLVVQLTAGEPNRALALVLIDAAVGETWDRLVRLSRVLPPVLLGVGGALAIDALTTLPVLRDPAQAFKLGRLVAPTVAGHVLRPWRMIGPAVSLIRSRSSRPLVEAVAERRVPVVVIHGDRDLAVPYQTARDTAREAHAWLVTVHGGTHSWLLKDPETLPGIVADLLRGPFGEQRRRVLANAGLDPDTATPEEIEEVFIPPDALVRELTPGPTTPLAPGAPGPHGLPRPPKAPRYRWTVEDPPEADTVVPGVAPATASTTVPTAEPEASPEPPVLR